MDGDVPIHSVRLPGIVADQDVILGDVGPDADASATSTTDRTSFMPGVLLAVRRVAELPESPDGRARAAARGRRSSPSPTTRSSATASASAACWTPRPEIAGARRRGLGGGRVGAAAERGTRPRPRPRARRDLVYVCLHDRPRGELVVVTLWEEGDDAAVPRRFTDAIPEPKRREPD